MASVAAFRFTEDEYLAIERTADFKSEFDNGQMFAMAGGTPEHARLTANVTAAFHRQMANGCRTYSSDLRVRVEGAGLYTYPDCTVICGEIALWGEHADVVTNPLLLVEVLSPATESYDRGKKFELYRSIPSLREYVIVHQDKRHIEHSSKHDDGSWILRDYADSAMFTIQRLNVTISLDEIYN
jgi:Uma2 family endonuclease